MQPKYDAFISYSQNDIRIAKALQDGIHRLAKRWDSLSAIKVFRDVTHLPITSLQPALVGALAESNYLILLASPQAAASKWVKEELASFLLTHPPERVLIVLLGGTLDWDEASGSFVGGPASALPQLDALNFAEQPIFLDLRWAASEPDLSLSNPRLLNVVGTLAATLQGVPKETLVGELVEEHRRMRRNQRLNLGFRGTTGFGIAAALFFLLGAAFSFTSSSVLAPQTAAYLYFVIGFPVVGAVGALCCGIGWRGVLGFALGFAALLPFYLAGSLQPFEGSLKDRAVLAAVEVAGFVAAGALGAWGSKWIRAFDGAWAFGIAGAIVVVLQLTVEGFRPAGIQTGLAEWPWLMTRFWLHAERTLAVAGDVFSARDTGLLVPMIVGVAIGGLLLGVRLADARSKTGEVRTDLRRERKSGRLSILLKSHWPARANAAALGLAVISWGFGLRDSHQIAQATRAFESKAVRGFLIAGDDNSDKQAQTAALPVALRTRISLEQRGEHAAAQRITALVREAILTFAATPPRYYERFRNPGYQPVDLQSLAQMLKEMGRPDELALLLDGVRSHLKGATTLQVIAAGRTQASLGSGEEAVATLETAAARIGTRERFERSLLAQAFFELGRVDAATEQWRTLRADIEAQRVSGAGSLIGLHDDLAPESGDSLWRTGVWNELPAWRSDLGEVLAVLIEGLCRRGEKDAVLSLIREHRQSTALWHAEARFAKAAVETQHFDLAFAVLDAMQPADSPGWTSFDDRASGLGEIVGAAKAHANVAVAQRALAQLRMIERTVRERNELNRFAGVTIVEGYARAGEFAEARRVAADISDDPWRAYLEIGRALGKAGNTAAAASMLAEAWRQVHSGGTAHKSHDAFSAIGMALAEIGELKAARSVAADVGSDFSGYGGSEKAVAKWSIYAAILQHGVGP